MAFVNALVDSRKFQEAMTGLQKNLRLPMKTVIRAETGSILKACAGDTAIETQQNTDRRARTRAIHDLGYGTAKARGDVTVNAGWRPAPTGRVWIRARNGAKGFILAKGPNFSPPSGTAFLNPSGKGPGTRVWLANVSDAIADVKAAWAKAIPMARGAIGLLAQSWVQIADRLGIALESVPGGGISGPKLAKARAAIASDGKAYINGQATQYENNQSYIIELTNSHPFCRRGGLDRVLVRRINGRANYFVQNLKRGVFDSVAATLRKYPGFKVAA